MYEAYSIQHLPRLDMMIWNADKGHQTSFEYVYQLKLSNIDFKNFANSNPVWAKISITLNFSYQTPEKSDFINHPKIFDRTMK